MKVRVLHKLSAVTLLSAAVAACVSPTVFTNGNSNDSLAEIDYQKIAQIQSSVSADPNFFAAQIATNNNPAVNNQYILRAAEIFIEQKKISAAQYYLQNYRAGLVPNQDAKYAQLENEIKNQLNNDHQQSIYDQKYNQSKALIQRMLNSNDYYTALVNSDELYPNLNNKNRTDLVNFTWTWLKNLSPDVLQNIKYLADVNANILAGQWVELITIYRSNRDNIEQLLQQYENWQIATTTLAHPAAITPPIDLSSKQTAIVVTNPNLYAALPLTGNLQPYGVAVRKGIEAAVTATNGQVKVTFLDTNNITNVINQLKDEHHLGIIGPLDSNNIQELVNAGHANQILGLNTSPSQVCTINFAQSLNHQAITAANFLYNQGYSNPMIILNSKQDSVDTAHTFSQRWLQLKSTHPIEAKFLVEDEIELKLQNALNTTPPPDVIYFLGNNQELINFSVLLNNTFYEAKLPVMANNQVITDQFTKGRRTDLDGLYITGDALVINKDSVESKNAQKSIGRNLNALYRMYSLGYDSFVAMQNLDKLKAIPNYRVQSLSGELYNLGDCQIVRDFSVYQLKSGIYQKQN